MALRESERAYSHLGPGRVPLVLIYTAICPRLHSVGPSSNTSFLAVCSGAGCFIGLSLFSQPCKESTYIEGNPDEGLNKGGLCSLSECCPLPSGCGGKICL